MDMGTDDLKVRANKAFKQVARNAEGSHAAAEREAADQAIRDKTERLKALRLEKEAAERLRSSGKGQTGKARSEQIESAIPPDTGAIDKQRRASRASPAAADNAPASSQLAHAACVPADEPNPGRRH
jgi:hypothetical protein